MSNFLFLKKRNLKLYNIIAEAENLFRDEYFEQSVVQVRRFAENLCKDILKDKISAESTFDDMINKIKDNSFENIRMKEFSEDLYFIKKQGNNSAHSSSAKKDGKASLECLERAYEIAVFYSNIKFGYDKKLDKTVFSEELLMTGKKTSKHELKEIYTKELKKTREKSNKTNKTSKSVKKPRKSNNKSCNFLKYFLIFTVLSVLSFLVGHFLTTIFKF